MNRFPTAALAVCAALAGDAAAAQGAGYATVAITATQMYDGNLLAAPASREPQHDLITRVGPTFDVGLRSERLTLTTRYGFAAERYLEHEPFSKVLARQDAAIAVQHHPSRRLALDLSGSYLSTTSPAELNVDSTLTAGRARAERLGSNGSASYAWTPITTVGAGLVFTRDVMEGGVSATVQEAYVRLDRHRDSPHPHRFEYRFQSFHFSDGGTEDWHVLTGRWRRDLTRRVALELTAGPRVADGSVRPELEALVRRRFQKGELSGGYSRTQATSFGETGAIDVQRVAGSAVYHLARRVTLTAAPTFAINERGDTRVAVYAFDFAASRWTRGGLGVSLAGRLGLQDGTLAGRTDRIPFRSVSLSMTAMLPRRAARTTEAR